MNPSDRDTQRQLQEELAKELVALKERGLTFTDCVQAFGVERDTDPHATAAFEQKQRDGELEIDDYTVVSESSDNGAYVLAWVWVDDPESGDDDDETAG